MMYEPMAARKFSSGQELRESYNQIRRSFFKQAESEITAQVEKDARSLADLHAYVERQVAEMHRLIEQTRKRQAEIDALRDGIEIQAAKVAALREEHRRLEEAALAEESKLDFKSVLEAVADAYGLHPRIIKSDSRQKHVVAARRHIVHILTLKRPDLSLPLIGRLLGGRDHTTILHARDSWPRHEALYERQTQRINALLQFGQSVDNAHKPPKDQQVSPCDDKIAACG